ncbi:MAG: HlyC/CorC family transporter [Bacillota bacterium]|nr:MAG: HlyC/CorC family transporter [Bacillota bacterium]
MGSSYWPYVFIIVLIALSAFFSGSEIAYASANKMRLKKAAESGRAKDKIAYFIYENYASALSTILIGNNLVNIAASSVATVIAINLGGESAVGYATAIMTVLILIFGEIMPKIVAKENCDGFSRAVALPLRFLMYLTKPLVIVIMGFVNLISRLWSRGDAQSPSVTEEELAAIIETVEDEGVIDEERSELLQSALEFSDIAAQEVLTPRVDMLAIDIDDSMDAIIELALGSPYSRIPVYEDSIDNIIGVLYLNHFLKQVVDQHDLNIRPLLMEVCFIHKTMKLPAVLAELKRRKLHLAVVTDEYGGTMGILTMEDVLEQLVGEIWDETDEIKNEFVSVGPDLYEVSGDLSIYDLFEYLDIDEDRFDGEYTTVGGWAIDQLGGYPQVGDAFDYQNLTVTVTEMDDLRITKLKVQARPPVQEDED